MAELVSKLTREDIETLIEAMGDWEMIGNHEFHVMSMIKNAPMPPEDHEAYDIMAQIKEHYRKRAKEIEASRVVRQEKAVFLKAKLMLARKDLGINQLFDLAANTDPNSPMPTPKVAEEGGFEPATNGKAVKVPVQTSDGDAQKKLEAAEFFIKDLGVWDHYRKFLQEREGGF